MNSLPKKGVFMKKLLIFLSFGLIAGNILPAVPKQSIFADHLVHKPEAIDTDKLAIAEAIIPAENKQEFYQAMVDLHDKGKLTMRNIYLFMKAKKIPVDMYLNPMTIIGSALVVQAAELGSKMQASVFGKQNNLNLTEKNILQVINAHRNSAEGEITFLRDLPITELLKERKNILIEEMQTKFLKVLNKSSLGDIVTEDYALKGACSLVFMALIDDICPQDSKKGCGAGFALGVLSAIAANNFYKLYKIRWEFRSREEEMRMIDTMIQQIEKIEAEETQQA
jgi:hypothetical protein